ncbi:hypothetical protein [Xylanimonas cellulosilytica]|uniref:hypothetical protein n=1 Tax=Xylanimonas cellulosilytica TaxID=186189 RepID=UPI00019BFEA9|nr:hypothetical protein [Xylanimonas cellulosilytica]
MQERGTTFLLTTHDLEDAERLAEHAVIISGCTKVFDGSLQDLKHSLRETKTIDLTLARNGQRGRSRGPVGRRAARLRHSLCCMPVTCGDVMR